MRFFRLAQLVFVFAAGVIAGSVGQSYLAPAAGAAVAGAAPDSDTPHRLPLGSYRAQVLRVIDGDTLEARVAVWMGQEMITKIRLRGIDAPEIRGACDSERGQALAARDALAALVGDRPVTLSDIGPDKYFGRVVARVGTPDGRDAGGQLLAQGLARPYGGRKRDGWCALPQARG